MTEGTRKRLKKLAIALGSSLAALFLVGGSTFAYVHFAYQDRIAPNVLIASVPVGGLASNAAEGRLAEALTIVAEIPVTLTGEGITDTITTEALGAQYDLTASVDEAFAVGRRPNPFFTVYDQLLLLLGDPVVVPVSVSYDRDEVISRLTALNQKLGNPAKDTKLTFTKGQLTLTDEQAGTAIDADVVLATLDQRLNQLAADRNLPFVLAQKQPDVSQEEASRLLSQLEFLVSAPMTLTVEGHDPFAVDATQLTNWIGFRRTDKLADERWIFGQTLAANGRASVIATIDEADVTGYLKTIAKQIDRPAVDAKLSISDGRATVFAASQTGRAVTLDQTLGAIAQAFVTRSRSVSEAALGAAVPAKADPLTIPIVIETTQPTVTNDAVNQLGIKELIGTGTTDFSGSPDNRVHNIETGTKYLTGRLIKPGESFSTVGSLGAVDASTGYLPELVIKENKTIPEFGGGLCQVSTTLFRSVMNAGLPITERTNHSYRVPYYERGVGPGLDATVYLPKPDFKFTNDTPGWILVQGFIKGSKLTFELYGTSDGRTSTIDGPHTISTQNAPGDVTVVDPNLAPGERKELQKRHQGATAVATYTVMRSGEQIHKQVFTSKYKAIAAQYAVGPDAAPSEEQPSSEQPVE